MDEFKEISPKTQSVDWQDISGTWTMVTTKEVQNNEQNDTEKMHINNVNKNQQRKCERNNNVVENNQQEEENEHQQENDIMKQSTEETRNGESSDEISILSECDSNADQELHVVNHLKEFNIQYATNNDIDIQREQNAKTEPSCTNYSPKSQMLIRFIIQGFNDIKSFFDAILSFKRGLYVGFYMGIILAVLIIISKTYNLNIENSLSKIDKLNQRIDTLEIHNNIMRGEIDLLEKQVKYLLKMNEKRQHKQYRENNKHDYKENDKQLLNMKKQKNDNEKIGKKIKRNVPEANSKEIYEYDQSGDSITSCLSDGSWRDGVCIKSNVNNKKHKSKDAAKNDKFSKKQSSNQYSSEINKMKQKYLKKLDGNDYHENTIAYENEYKGSSSNKPKRHQNREDKRNNGEWQLNYMKNRENARLNQYEENEENWFIKRSNDRRDKRFNNRY